MDGNEKARLDRLNRAAEAEKGPDDPQAVRPRAATTLIVMICAALVVAAGLIGVMYFNNYDSPHSVPVAQGQGK